jgi:PPOX class probable F420-dependent enzyme
VDTLARNPFSIDEFKAETLLASLPYNVLMPIPQNIRGQGYISLATFRKNGTAVPTPVWFGEEDDKLYVMTRSDSGKYKRLRNNSQVRIAPCTIRGKITGPELAATARILPPEDWPLARKTIQRKYWLARVPFLWSKNNVYIEIAA